MIEKKYQIFISSTYKDLKSERDKAIKTILSMEQIPIGMEMFNAGDESQWELIKRTIDRTDYYIVIIGFRYGFVDDDGISFTEKEYDYAISKGIPVLAFIKDNSIPSTPEQRESDPAKQERLNNFINKATNKIARFWKVGDELTTHISTSLMTEMKREPMIGWVRDNQLLDLSNEGTKEKKSASNSYEKKLRQITEEISSDTNNSDNYFQRGNFYERERFYGGHRNIELAIDDYTEAIRLNPNIADYYGKRANCYIKLKRFEEASSDYTEAIRLDSDKADYYNERADCYKELKRFEEAISDYTENIRLSPNNSHSFSGRADCYKELKKYKEAIDDYTSSMKCGFCNVKHYEKRGLLYYHLRDYNKAIEDFTEAIRIEKKILYYWARAYCYEGLYDYKKALKNYKLAMEILDAGENPNTRDKIELYIQLAYALYKTNEEDLAFEYLDMAYDLNGQSPLYYYTKGKIHLKMAKTSKILCKPETLDYFSRAIDLAREQNDDDINKYYTHRAEYFLYVGLTAEANNDLQEA